MQGSRRPLRVRHSARNLTDAGGLVLLRKLFDRLGLADWIDGRTNEEKGFYGRADDRGVDRAAALRRWGDR